MNKGLGVQSQDYQVITKKYGALARPKKKKITTYKTKQLYMTSQQVNRSTTSQVKCSIRVIRSFLTVTLSI